MYYGINCSHPGWFEHLFDLDEPWVKRIRMIRGNGSEKSHDELDGCDTLDTGDPEKWGLIQARIHNKNHIQCQHGWWLLWH